MKHTVLQPKRDPARPIDEPLPNDVADQKWRRNPMFEGLCYVCGFPIRGLMCPRCERASEGKR